MSDFKCKGHPERPVAWQDDECWECRNRKQKRWERRVYGKPWRPSILEWILIYVGATLLIFGAVAALGAHYQVKSMKDGFYN